MDACRVGTPPLLVVVRVAARVEVRVGLEHWFAGQCGSLEVRKEAFHLLAQELPHLLLAVLFSVVVFGLSL